MGITVSPDTGTTFESGAAEYIVVKALDANTFVVAYRDGNDTNKGKAVVGTRIGTTITVSESDIEQFETDEVSFIGLATLSASLFVIHYINASDTKEYVIAGSVSGTTITFGSPVNIANELCRGVDVCELDSTNFVAFYSDAGTNGQAAVCSVSGTTITVGTPTGFETPIYSASLSCGRLNGTDFFVAFAHNDGSYYYSVKARVGVADVGTKTITWGATVDLETATLSLLVEELKVATFDELHFVVLYYDLYGNGKLRAGAINETTHAITVGSPTYLTGNPHSQMSICTMDSTHFLCASYFGGPGYLQAGSLSGSTTLTIDDEGQINFDTDTITYTGICNLDGEYFLVGFKET